MLRVTANTQLMREIVDLLSVLTEEAKMSWGEKGLTVNVVDGSHVALLSCTFSNACFETYEVEPVEIGLELGKLRDLLTLAGPSDLVEIDYDDASEQSMSESARFTGYCAASTLALCRTRSFRSWISIAAPPSGQRSSRGRSERPSS